jgi:signal transduction histidine kinase
MTEIHRPVPNALHCIDMTVPIVSRDGHTLTALLLFRIDPRLLLFPLVQSWPLPSVSSEALLVRSDGDSLLYLNEARHLLSAAGVLRGALRTPRLAATAASRGANASFEGPDYRGHEVLAAAHPVEGTGWTLLAKTDRDEVLASFDRRVGIVLLLLAILLGLSAVGFGLVWRMHRMEDDLTLRTAETLQDAILNSLTLNIAVLNDRGIIVSVNESWRRFALENGCRDTGAIGVGANYLAVCEAAIAGGEEGEARAALEGIRGVLERRLEGFQLEYPCHSPEEQRWFEMRVSRLEAPGTGVVVAHETITGRKRAAAEQQALLDMLRRLSSRLESAREEERAHIAREVHDEFGQALTAMKMDLQDIRTRGGSLESAVLRRLRSMEELIDRSVVTVQRLASELRPPMLDELGLLAAAEWYVQDVVDRSGIVCVRERMDAPPPSDRPRVTALYRVLQEALTNILRHAGATEIRLSLEYSSGKVILKVRDNGRGITTGELSSMQSLGVLGMRERLQAHGGELVIRGSPGQGTLVVARLPWPTADPVSFRP